MDKTALITGAARRIGAATAEALHAIGFRVAVHFHTSEQDAKTFAGLLNERRPDSAITVQGDLTDPKAAPAIVAEIGSAWDGLDLLVNNASIYGPTDIESADVEHWDRLMATNLRAPYLLSTSAIPLLRARRGSIVNLTDIYGVRPQAGHTAYCVSKAGLIGLTKALARDLAPEIRVNGVSPGPIIWADSDKPEYRAEVLKRTPLGLRGETSDIGGAVCYLAEASYVTGQIIEVDGGRSIFL